MKAYRRNGDIPPLVLNLGPILRRVFTADLGLFTLDKILRNVVL